MTLEEFKKTVASPLRQVTLTLLVRDNQVLLAMKKRGFGAGRWNGCGGKPAEDDTSIEDTARRETLEEISVMPTVLNKCAQLSFYFPHNPDWCQQMLVYLVDSWEGEPTESDEMKPQWFDFDKLPFEKMWPDDIHWLSRVLAGENIQGEFLFGENDTILDFSIHSIPQV